MAFPKIAFIKKKVITLLNFSSSFSINFENLTIEHDFLLLDKLTKDYRQFLHDDSLDDCFYRSFLQYKCQMAGANRMKKIILDLIAVVLFPFYVAIALICNVTISSKITNDNKKPTAVLAVKIKDDLIQRSLTERYTIVNPKTTWIILDKRSFNFLRSLLHLFPHHPYFILKCMIKVSTYSYYCIKYNPDAIITTSEYSFTSSILTRYLEQLSVKHINIMHGEKIYNIRDSFFRFSECIVWDQYYVDLLCKLRAYPKQFHVELPPRHLGLLKYKRKTDNSLNNKLLKFYWASEVDGKELEYITKELIRLQDSGIRVVIRNHPVYGEHLEKIAKHYFRGFPIENPFEIDIYDSLAETDYVFGTYTTVLYEASLMGKVIVINDFRDYIDQLNKIGLYVIKKCRYIPLSALMETIKND